MSAWWDGLTALQQLLYCIAVPSTIVMLLQTILMLIGLGGHGDLGGHGPIDGSVSHDIPNEAVVLGHSTIGHGGAVAGAHETSASAGHDAKPGGSPADSNDVVSFRLFTFQTILIFFVVFGWTGISVSTAVPAFTAILVAFLAGTAALFLTAWMFYGLMKLQNSGNVRLSGAIGLEGEVYIPIPANGKGQGKVNLLLQGRWLECEAATLGLEPLNTKQAIRVVGLQGGSVLIVESINRDK
jgi:hypothetical protein